MRLETSCVRLACVVELLSYHRPLGSYHVINSPPGLSYGCNFGATHEIYFKLSESCLYLWSAPLTV
jgi:hypothetical protein